MKDASHNPMQEALRRSQRAEAHPDPDLLAAFAEGALLERERENVLAHLAVCNECRGVLHLASGAAELPAEQAQVAAAAPAIEPVRTLLWLRWAGLAAGVLLAVTGGVVVWMHFARGPQTQIVASNRRAGQAAASIEIAQAVPAPGPKQAVAGQRAAALQTAPRSAKVAGKPAPLAALARPEPQAAPEAKSEQALAPAATSVASAAKQSESIVPAALPADAAATKAMPQGELTAGHQPASSLLESENQPVPAPSAAPAEYGTARVPLAAPATQPKRAFTGAEAELAVTRAGAGAPMRPHWRISADGRVECAYGDGPWREALVQEHTKMRVVYVAGGEVWAGGEGTRLYRSADNGTTWTRVELPEKRGAEHTIVHLRFESARRGTVEAEDGTAWSTSDGGRTWR